jgi:putative ABC transport system substrate-binding protein
MDFIRRIIPNVQTIGLLYNSSEVNSVIQIDMAKARIRELGLVYVEAIVTGTADVAQAVESIVGRVDVIYTPTDNTIASAMRLVANIADERRVPIIAAERGGVELGALATVGIDYYNLGRQTGAMAVRILRDGADPATMPIEYLREVSMTVNTDALARLGFNMPDDVMSGALLIGDRE